MTCRSFFFLSRKFFFACGAVRSLENKPVVRWVGKYMHRAFQKHQCFTVNCCSGKKRWKMKRFNSFFWRSRLPRPLLEALCWLPASDNAQNLSAVSIPFLCGGIVSIIPLVPTRRTTFLFKQKSQGENHQIQSQLSQQHASCNPTQTTTTTEHHPHSHPSPSPYQTLPTSTKPVAPHLFSIIATLRDNFFLFFDKG